MSYPSLFFLKKERNVIPYKISKILQSRVDKTVKLIYKNKYDEQKLRNCQLFKTAVQQQIYMDRGQYPPPMMIICISAYNYFLICIISSCRQASYMALNFIQIYI